MKINYITHIKQIITKNQASNGTGSRLIFSFLGFGSSMGIEGNSISDIFESNAGTSGRFCLIISANSKSTASSSSAVKAPAKMSSIS